MLFKLTAFVRLPLRNLHSAIYNLVSDLALRVANPSTEFTPLPAAIRRQRQGGLSGVEVLRTSIGRDGAGKNTLRDF